MAVKTSTKESTAEILQMLSGAPVSAGLCKTESVAQVDEQDIPENTPELQAELSCAPTHELDYKHVLNMSLADTEANKNQK